MPAAVIALRGFNADSSIDGKTEVDLKGGKDRLTFNDSTLADELQADGGSGSHRFRN